MELEQLMNEGIGIRRLNPVRSARHPTTFPAAFACAVLIVVMACGGKSPDLAAPVPEVDPNLRPGDAIQVEIWREPDLSGKFQVNEEGAVVFPLLGRRQVTRMTPDSLQRRLVDDYREYLDNPSVNVTVLRRISIVGEVRKPGLYPVDPTVSLSDALAMAGGVTPRADTDEIRLIRGESVVRSGIDRGQVVGTLPIRSGDRIWVGEKSWFARNWQWVGGTLTTISVFALFR